jgi:hypothetical protein
MVVDYTNPFCGFQSRCPAETIAVAIAEPAREARFEANGGNRNSTWRQSSTDWRRGHPEGSISSVDLFEVEISQIHVAIRQYVYGENVLAFAERNCEKLRSQIPVVPLTPGHRICRIIRCRDL